MASVPNNPYQAHIYAIEKANGRPFIGAPLRGAVRGQAEELAVAAGMSEADAQRVSDGDLCSLYAVARSSPTQVQITVGRIMRKLGVPNPLLDPVVQTPRPDPKPRDPPKGEPIGWPEPAPAPAPAPVASEPVDWERVHTIARLAAGTACEALQGDLDAALAGIPEMAANAAREALSALQPTNLIVTLPNAEPVALGTVHRKTADIIKAISAGVNVYLYGPAGSGKTTVARKVSEAFKLPFYFAAKVESEYMLLGFKDARGETVRTQFRDAYENGGVFLFDELDGSSPAAVVALNAALANGICPFPDGTIERHADFHCIAAGNTKLTGANRQYVGRTQLDAASIDRFAFIEFGYDTALEMALATDKAWARYVIAVRAAIDERGFTHLVTPRATIDGGKLLAAGFDRDTVEAMSIWKGLDADTVTQIKTALQGSN